MFRKYKSRMRIKIFDQVKKNKSYVIVIDNKPYPNMQLDKYRIDDNYMNICHACEIYSYQYRYKVIIKDNQVQLLSQKTYYNSIGISFNYEKSIYEVYRTDLDINNVQLDLIRAKKEINEIVLNEQDKYLKKELDIKINNIVNKMHALNKDVKNIKNFLSIIHEDVELHCDHIDKELSSIKTSMQNTINVINMHLERNNK